MNPSTLFSDKSPSSRGVNTKEYIKLVIREFYRHSFKIYNSYKYNDINITSISC